MTQVTLLDFEVEHAQSYNGLVDVVKRNLLLADWHDPSHRESLLSPRNSTWAAQMLKNVRQSCCVAGAINLTAKEEDLLETLELIAERLGLPAPAPLGTRPSVRSANLLPSSPHVHTRACFFSDSWASSGLHGSPGCSLAPAS